MGNLVCGSCGAAETAAPAPVPPAAVSADLAGGEAGDTHEEDRRVVYDVDQLIEDNWAAGAAGGDVAATAPGSGDFADDAARVGGWRLAGCGGRRPRVDRLEEMRLMLGRHPSLATGGAELGSGTEEPARTGADGERDPAVNGRASKLARRQVAAARKKRAQKAARVLAKRRAEAADAARRRAAREAADTARDKRAAVAMKAEADRHRAALAAARRRAAAAGLKFGPGRVAGPRRGSWQRYRAFARKVVLPEAHHGAQAGDGSPAVVVHALGRRVVVAETDSAGQLLDAIDGVLGKNDAGLRFVTVGGWKPLSRARPCATSV